MGWLLTTRQRRSPPNGDQHRTHTINIIRHSDDLGVTHQATQQLIDAWRAGHLDGFSIIVNGDAAARVQIELSDAPELAARIAVHFNLTEGRSSAAATVVPLLVDDRGLLKHSFGSLLVAAVFSSPWKRRELLRQISYECTAQIGAARALCGARLLTAIDGHIHVHMIPGIFSVVARAARDAGIPEIRITAEPFHITDPWRDLVQPFWWINLIKHLLLRAFSISARAITQRNSLRAPGAFIGVLYSGKMTAARALRGIKSAVAAEEIEVVFHVGRATSVEAARWPRAADAAANLSEWRDIERKELGRLSEHLRADCRPPTKQ